MAVERGHYVVEQSLLAPYVLAYAMHLGSTGFALAKLCRHRRTIIPLIAVKPVACAYLPDYPILNYLKVNTPHSTFHC